MEPQSQARMPFGPSTWCVFYGCGIILLLGMYGVLQERIMAHSYAGEFFEYSAFLVFCNRFVAVIYALFMAIFRREPLVNSVPIWKYSVVSLSNVLATCCQYEALKWVSFPVQMLGKSFKMMPVMLWGILISKKRYGVTDWIVAGCVTAGVTFFLLTGPIIPVDRQVQQIISGLPPLHGWYGLVLLLAFLFCDGLTSTMQEKLFRDNVTSKYNQMMYVNLLSCAVSLCMLLFTGNLPASFAFCYRHPNFLLNAFELSISAVAGQWFIFSQVKDFGALVLAATMNVRQVVSTMMSYIQYDNLITPQQVLGLVLVFGALFYKSYAGFAAMKKDETQPLMRKGDQKKQREASDPNGRSHATPAQKEASV